MMLHATRETAVTSEIRNKEQRAVEFAGNEEK
jgi:hypothetical protein